LNIHRFPLEMQNWGVMRVKNLAHYWLNYRRLRQLVVSHRIDQIHCGRILPEGLWGWWLNRRMRVLYCCYVHGEEIRYYQKSRELTWLMHRVLGSATAVIANSRNTCQVLQDRGGVPANKIRLLYPGVDVHRFVPADRNPQVRQSLGWDEQLVVLTVGRLQARKGQDRLILATKQLLQKFPELLYVIVGDGEERPHLERLVNENHLERHVQFRHNTSDDELIQCYQQCDLFVLPNREVNGDFEGFGMVLLEAQACGRPVVAGTSGGTAETMKVPATGRLVCCDEPGPLAELLAELLSDRDKMESMGLAGRQWVLEHFDWEQLSQQAYSLFQSMAGAKSNSGDNERNRSDHSWQISHESHPEAVEA
jgi:phosphatidylinositol alpha-1,6-mannosyltransferase